MEECTMQMGISQVDMAILLPVCAAAWNLVGGQTPFSGRKNADRVYLSPDGCFVVEAPADWERSKQDGSNELTLMKGQVSVCVAAAKTEDGDTVDQFMEFNKSLLRSMSPAAEVWGEGPATVAGASGAYFTMLCPSPRGRTIVRVAAALVQRRLYIFKTAAPSAELYTAQAAINRIEQSFRVGTGLPQDNEASLQAH
jgi:hypothetical protein